jgi:hypothetical protein
VAWEIVSGILALTAIAALIWSLVSIPFTLAATQNAAGLMQWKWLVVITLMPMTGAALFLLTARRRLAQAGSTSTIMQAMGE